MWFARKVEDMVFEVWMNATITVAIERMWFGVPRPHTPFGFGGNVVHIRSMTFVMLLLLLGRKGQFWFYIDTYLLAGAARRGGGGCLAGRALPSGGFGMCQTLKRYVVISLIMITFCRGLVAAMPDPTSQYTLYSGLWCHQNRR